LEGETEEKYLGACNGTHYSEYFNAFAGALPISAVKEAGKLWTNILKVR
jgi:hypothetical protein